MDLWFIQGNENVFVSGNFLRDRRPFLFVIPTRISCHVALDAVACAPFSEGKAHEVRQRHQVPQEIRGSEAEGSAVRLSVAPNLNAGLQSLRHASGIQPAR
jgi:hypothetical protein